jgi:predicted O-methyltransferase YrrM
VRPGSHFDFFLDRATLRDGRVTFSRLSQEERDGSLAEAHRQYLEAGHERAAARTTELLRQAATAALKCQTLSQQLEPVEGFLHPFEGFVLYWLGSHWPVNGRTVEIGSFKGRSTCWLAAGCKDGNRAKVAAVDHFRGSAEHQRGGSHEDPDVAGVGSTLPVFTRNVEKNWLADWVTVHVGASAEVSQNWREPIRLLFIDGDHSYQSTAQDFQYWSRFLPRHGLVVFHDIGPWPGVTKFYSELSSQRGLWRTVGLFHTLGVLERLA